MSDDGAGPSEQPKMKGGKGKKAKGAVDPVSGRASSWAAAAACGSRQAAWAPAAAACAAGAGCCGAVAVQLS